MIRKYFAVQSSFHKRCQALFAALLMAVIFSPRAFAVYWTENKLADFGDGYYYLGRTTATSDNTVTLSPVTDWYDTNWENRKPLNINNSASGQVLKDYQLQFTLDTAVLISVGKMREDMSDIRFADSDGKTMLGYYIASASGTQTQFVVKVSSIPITNKTIFLYYNNVSTTSMSSKRFAYDLFEDFEQGLETKWETGGDTPFSVVTSSAYEGTHAARSGNIADSQISFIKTSINMEMAGYVTFYWAASSEHNYDQIHFYVNGVELASTRPLGYKMIPTGPTLDPVYDEKFWEMRVYSLGVGINELKWQFRRDNTGIGGINATWVDYITAGKYIDSPPQVTPSDEEAYSGFYTEGIYQSSVLDTGAERAEVQFTSWTVYAGGGTNVSMSMRSSETSFNKDNTQISWASVNYRQKPTLLPKGRYLQYMATLTCANGTTTPYLMEVSIEYTSPPTAPSGFSGVAQSSTSIKWTWNDNSSGPILQESGFRLYSSTGIIATLNPDTVEYTENYFQPNTRKSRWVGAYNSFGENLSAGSTVYTKAHEPCVKAQEFNLLAGGGYSYTAISTTGTVLYKSTFTFTSDKDTTTIGGYYIAFSSDPDHVVGTSDTFWSPLSSYVLDLLSHDPITKIPEMYCHALYNATSFYYFAGTYNNDGVPSGITRLGPFNFQGCPAGITDLTAEPSTDKEGSIVLTWTAPSADGSRTIDLTPGKYILKGRADGAILNDTHFQNAEISIIISTSAVAGHKQTYILNGLTPNAQWGFAIKSVDSDDNYSTLSTNVIPANTMCRASAITKIAFFTGAKTTYVGKETSNITIETRDANDKALKVTSNITINLNSTSLTRHFWDGSWGVTSVLIHAGASQATFKYKDETSGAPTISAVEYPTKGWAMGEQIETVAPGKGLQFKIDHDGTGNTEADQTITVRANDGYQDTNTSKDFLGDIVVTCTVAGITITPSTYTFTAADEGHKAFTVGNKGDNAIAGPVVYSVQEVVTQDYTNVLNSMLIGDGGMIRSRDDAARWFTQRYSSGTENALYGLSSPDAGTNVWASGTAARVLKSSDSGDTWTSYNTGLAADKTLYSVYFVDVSTGWAVGSTGKIVKSGDGGLTWYEQSSTVGTKLNSVYFVDLSTGWIVGDGGTLLKTIDSGEHWTSVGLGGSNLNKVYFLDSDPQTGFITGDGGKIYKTTNAGVSWTGKTVPVSADINSIDFFSASLGYAAGDLKTLLKTTDGGESWNLMVSTAATPNFYGVSFVGSNSNMITAVGSGGKILQTINSGSTWSEQVMNGESTPFTWNALVVSSAVSQASRLVQGKINPGIMVAVRTFVSGTAEADKIIVKRSAASTSADDGDVTSIVVYRDANNNQTYDANDVKMGEQAFSSGKATINISRTFSTTTDYLFIMPNLSLRTEALGKTLGLTLEFSDPDKFIHALGEVKIARNNLPFTSPALEILPSSCTVSMGILDLSPSEVKQGQRDVLISSFTMKTDRGETAWRRLIIARNGVNNVDSDIESVKLWKSVSPYYSDASVIATGVFGSVSQGLSYIDLSPEQSINSTTTNYYFLSVDVSPSAVYYTATTDARFWLSFGMTTSYFLLDSEGFNGISPNMANFTSTQIRIKQAFDTMEVVPIPILDFNVDQSRVAPCLPVKIYVTESGGRVDITKLHVVQSGTASDSDIESVRFYRDTDGNGILDAASDKLLGSASLSSKEGDIILDIPETITGVLLNYATYFVAAAVTKRATVESTIKLNIAPGGISLAGADVVSTANFPMASPVATIKNYRDKVNVTFTNLSPREARVDETGIAVAKIKLWAYCGAALTKMTLEHTGTGNYLNVKAIKLYSDTNGDETFSSADDALIGSGAFGADSKSSISLSSPLEVYDSSSTIFVVYDLESGATPQKTAGMGVSDSSMDFPGEDGSKNTFGYYQTDAINLLSKETPSVPSLALNIGCPYGKKMGGKTVYFSNQSTELQFSWQSQALNGIAEAKYALATFSVFGTTDTPNMTSWFTTSEKDAKMQDLNLKHNTLYYLWVKAVSTDGYERVSSVPMKVDLTPPDTPSKPKDTSPRAKSAIALAASNAPSSSYWVSWDTVDDIESGVIYYDIQERVGTSPVWHSVSTTTAAEFKIVKSTETDTGKFFYYRVRAMNYAGTWGSFSDGSAAAYLSLPPEFVKDLASYPNPFDSRKKSATITFLLNQDATVLFKIFDLFGGLVKEWSISAAAGENRSSWDGCDSSGQKVAAGMYILYTEIQGSDTTEKKRWKIGVIH